MPSPVTSRPPSPTPSQLPPVPGSPVYSIASTANPLSNFNLPLPPAPRPSHALLTKADLEASHQAYSDLLASAKSYRLALATLSTAASSFASALEACARLKESRAEPIGHHAAGTSMTASFTTKGVCTADTLLSASGVHHLIANHHQILSETVYRSFEVPLLHDLDKWQTVIDDEEETYQHKIKAQSREVKRLEKEGLKLHKQRRRDVARFRAHLVELTRKLDGLTTLHADHSRALLRESQDTSGRIVDASCSLVRAEVDIFESLARKGWTGGGLDDLLEKGTDLFAADDAGGHAAVTAAAAAAAAASSGSADTAKLFSILPPKSILADSASELSRPGHGRGDSLLGESDRYQSLAALALATEHTHNGAGAAAAAAGDADSVFSADFNKPRGARPFSPQPIRRVPADVTFESLRAMGEAPAEDADDDDDDEQEDEEGVENGEQDRGRRRRSTSDLRGDTDHGRQESAADTWADS
ncbi:Phospholipid-binding protein [Metarhizium album ARSEF 1941]|uniref:Phospholipid-binding protein n=1 Tax=Metarhizium album (strain ARSEF 1941) TaxID=1081103 RepID=A0A0B2X6B9_METAS|nr:Phospholipid-binding protein [Metarhizium album ARSEF 1941]KHO01278.1 Phospholipid-binding protein [Metarhizium album ARSEF 1941]